jgi:hypothetical protein
MNRFLTTFRMIALLTLVLMTGLSQVVRVQAAPPARPLAYDSSVSGGTFDEHSYVDTGNIEVWYYWAGISSASGTPLNSSCDGMTGQLSIPNGQNAYIRMVGTPLHPGTCQIDVKVTPTNGEKHVLFSMTFNNVNEAPSISLAPSSVSENAGAGVLAGTYSTYDPDDAEGYGTGASVWVSSGEFSASGGGIYTQRSFNYEAETSAGVTVTVSDGAATASSSGTVFINNVNEYPSAPGLTGSSITENSPIGSFIGSLSSSDPDAGTTITYSLPSYGDNALFTINGSSLLTNAAVDYEVVHSRSIRVRATDNGGLYAESDYTISIGNVEEPPIFSNANPTALTTLEDHSLDLTVNASDPEGSAVTYTVGAPAHGSTGLVGTTLTYTPAPDYNGSDSFIASAWDSGSLVSNITVNVTVTSVNDPPVFNAGVSPDLLEDTPAQTVIGWAQNVSTGPANESGQLLSYRVVSNSNPELFSSSPTVNANGVLQYTVAPDANGIATIELQVSDNGGTINNGVDTGNTVTFTITVNPINDPPSFSVGTAPTVLEDSGAQTFTTWTQNVSQGPTNEVSQTLIYTLVSNTNPSLFSSVPAVSSNGTLTFTPAANANGSSTIGFSVTDNGGTASGGNDTGPTQTFVITVTPVNDPPTFSAGISPVIPEDSTAQTIVGWPQSVSLGAADESAQVLTYTIQSNSNSALFTVQPAVDSNGVLTFTPKANAHGTSSLSVSVVDSGGNSNGGSAAGPTRTFSITLNPVNDAPVLDSTGSSSVTSINEDDITNSGMRVSDLLATGAGGSPVSDVDDNVLEGIGRGIAVIESSQDAGHGAWQYSLDGSTWLAFGTPSSSAARLLDVSARVRFVPEANWNGSIGQALTYRAWDEKPGSGANGGTADITVDGAGFTTAFSASYEIASFTVQPINDAPLLDTGGVMKLDTILEDQPINGGTSVAAIVASAGGDRISEVSYEINPLEGIAVTAADNSQGAWQYSLNNGLDWTDFGTPDAAHARLLVSDTNTKIRFLPSLDWSLLWENAALPAITFQAWDRISGVNGGTGDASQNGLTTAYSTDSTTASITVTGRNDAPTFSKGVDITLDEGALAQTLPAWVTSISAGPADEVAKPQEQTVHFNIVYNTNPSLFTVVPAISPTGELTFTPEPQAYGTATIIFELQDSGGTGSSGTDTSPLAFFVIELREVNDPPVFTPGANQSVAEDSGAQTLSAWASAISAGPANEAWQDLTFVVLSNSNPGLFSAAPAISPTGALTYTPAANANGSATLTVYLHDGGGSLNGGTPDSTSATFTIAVTPVNDPPTNTVLPLISGQAYVNQVLSVTSGTWNDAIDIAPGTITYSYQWQAADDASGANLGDIASASANQYSVELAQANRYLRVKVTATDNGEGVPASQSTIAYSAYVRVEGVNPAVTVSAFTKTIDEDTLQKFALSDFSAHYSHTGSLALERIRLTSLPQHGSLFVDANSSSTLDSGEGAQLNQEILAADLNLLIYQPAANWHGEDAFVWNATNAPADGYPLPGPGVQTTLTVAAVNDPVTLTVPGTTNISENQTSNTLVYTLGDVDVALADPASSEYEMDLSASFGTLRLVSTTGLTFLNGSSDQSETIAAQGTMTDLQAAFNGVLYTPHASYTGEDTILAAFKDHGSSGSGPAQTASGSTTLLISDINNAPLNSLPAPFTVDINTVSPVLDFSFDDDSNSFMQFTFSANHGGINLPDTKALTLVSGANNAHAMTYRGPVLKVIRALLGLHYTPDKDYAGPDTITYTINDLGGTGTGGAKSDSDTLAVIVNAPAAGTADTIYLPANSVQTSAAPGVMANDSDINLDPMTVEVVTAPAYGTLDLKSDGSYTYTPPKGLTGLVTFTYRIYDGRLYSEPVTAAFHLENDLETHLGSQSTGDLVTFTYTAHNPAAQSTFTNLTSSFKIPAGVEVVNLTHGIFTPDPAGGGTISADPQASLLPGETFSMTWTLRRSGSTPITGTWETSNDRTSDYGTFSETLKTIDEDTLLALLPELGSGFSGTGSRALASIEVMALPQHGTLFVDLNSSGKPDAGESLALNQSVAAASLPKLSYLPDANWYGQDGWSWKETFAMDSGTAAAGPQTSMLLTAQSVNDIPVVTAPAGFKILEDTFSDPFTISLSDVDTLMAGSPAQNYAVQLACTSGKLKLGSVQGITFGAGQDESCAMTLTGALTDLQSAVTGLVYTPSLRFNGIETVQFTLNDHGNNGSGGDKSATASLEIDVTSQNNTPVNSLPASLVLDVDTRSAALAFGIDDDSTEEMQFNLSATHGSLSVDSPDLLSLDSGANHSHSLTYHGAVQAVLAALNGIRYQPDSGYFGPDEITFATNDLGGSGFGGPMTDSDTLAVKVNAAPVSSDDTYTAIRGTVLTLPAGALLANDTDANLDTLETRLVDAPTAGTLDLKADGGFTYTPPTLFDGDVSFSYAAWDGRLLSNTAVVTLHVIKEITRFTFTIEGNEVFYTFTAINPTDNQTFNDLGIQFNLPEGAELIALDNGVYTTGDGHGIVSSNPIPALKPGEQYYMTWRIKIKHGGIIPCIWTITHDGTSSTGAFNIVRYYMPILSNP